MYPFKDGDTFATLRALTAKVKAEVSALDNEYVLKTSEVELQQFFVENVLFKPLVLHVDERYIENEVGVDIDVSDDFRRGVFPGERAVIQTLQFALSSGAASPGARMP